MADTDDKKNEEGTEAGKDEQPKQSGKKISILTWIIMVAVVAILAGSGFVLGRLFTGSSSPETTESSQENAQTEETKSDDSKTDSENTWYYELEPVIANLDEPNLTRFARITITLQISSNLERKEGEKIIENKKLVLTNWLTNYLASLTLEDARGGRNQMRIQAQILDAFNETLFPDAKPQIKRILFKEFVID